MPVSDVTPDPERLTLTVRAEFAADQDRAWRLFEDPRQLERWWGPPGWPATFHRHELEPGRGALYSMTSDGTRDEEGETHYGIWSVLEVDPPRSFTVEDAFSDENGVPDATVGSCTMSATLEPGDAGTRVTFVTTFASREQLDTMLGMGMAEGMRQAMNQIDGIVAEEAR